MGCPCKARRLAAQKAKEQQSAPKPEEKKENEKEK